METHNAGKGAKYTKTRLPVKLVYSEEFDDKESAMKREWFIKNRLSRADKLELIQSVQNRKPEREETHRSFVYDNQAKIGIIRTG